MSRWRLNELYRSRRNRPSVPHPTKSNLQIFKLPHFIESLAGSRAFILLFSNEKEERWNESAVVRATYFSVRRCHRVTGYESCWLFTTSITEIERFAHMTPIAGSLPLVLAVQSLKRTRCSLAVFAFLFSIAIIAPIPHRRE